MLKLQLAITKIMLKAVIFDLDGVLVNTEPLYDQHKVSCIQNITMSDRTCLCFGQRHCLIQLMLPTGLFLALRLNFLVFP